MKISDRFRGYLPIVVDVETSGFNADTNALLEFAAIIVNYNASNKLAPIQTIHYHLSPFKNAVISESAMKFNGIILGHPFRKEVSEKEALSNLFTIINKALIQHHCTKAILVGHNAMFDLSFIQAGAARHQLKSPFHQFSTLDTVSLSALAYGETVLAKAIAKANIDWDNDNAHGALYDTQKTAELFCQIINEFAFTLVPKN